MVAWAMRPSARARGISVVSSLNRGHDLAVRLLGEGGSGKRVTGSGQRGNGVTGCALRDCHRALPASRLQKCADPAPVDRNRAARDVAGALGGEKRGEGGELAGLAEPAHWDFFFPLGESVFA